METTDYCSYELSKALKACGFDEPCRYCYIVDKDTETLVEFTEYASRSKWNSAEVGGSKYPYKHISAPSLWQAQKWLREKHHISVRVSYIHYHKVWFADWLNLDSGEFDDTDATFATYEEALADGISVALELIEQENK